MIIMRTTASAYLYEVCVRETEKRKSTSTRIDLVFGSNSIFKTVP